MRDANGAIHFEIASIEWLLYLTALSSWFRLVINTVPSLSDKP